MEAMTGRYANVIVDISHEKLDRFFQYKIPDELLDKLRAGMAVTVPFGAGNKPTKGYVMEITDSAEYDEDKLKYIGDVIENAVTAQDSALKLAGWIKENYGSTMIAALRTTLPVKRKVKKRASRTANFETTSFPEKRPARLSDAQADIVNQIFEDYEAGKRGTYLIHGVTGSGKTEVYMELIERICALGRQAIVLIPEIALTYQTLARFYSRFGERVSVLNSRLSDGERSERYELASQGKIDVMIGPRSALFTPFEKLGVVIIDEEHEASYKSESMPKYHAREVAGELCRMKGASLVLGSATPSVETYYRAMRGDIKLFTLKDRLAGGVLAHVHGAVMGAAVKCGNRSVLPRRRGAVMDDRLQKGEQTMLFLNRRGYAGFVSCRSCGYVAKCPHCDVSLSEHNSRDGGKLVCHYCGYETSKLTKCPECGSKYILGFRAGTQQVEELINKEFPNARVLRMDADTTRKKGSYEQILSSFANGDADILVGTQMIVKGHDFAGVTLVGIVAADMSLHRSDFRAGERTFQLLVQAAGRAGRSKDGGEVVIQTYQPDNYAIVRAASQDYEGFYEEEMSYRDLMLYPPAAQMLAVLVLSADEGGGRERAVMLSDLARKQSSENGALVVGPASAGIGKINDIYRFVFYVKHRDYDVLVAIKDALEGFILEKKWDGVSLLFDFNPINGY